MNLKDIRLVALDVDGTLTDGRLLYGPEGVSQAFSAKDGQGIMKLLQAGVQVAFVSFRDLPSTRMRASDLGVSLLCLGSSDKALSLKTLRITSIFPPLPSFSWEMTKRTFRQ